MSGSLSLRLLAGVVLSVVLTSGLARDGAISGQAVTPSTPGTERRCAIAPRDSASFVALLDASPVALRTSLVDAFRDSTTPASEDDLVAVGKVLSQLEACANAGDFARTAALFTDGFWRREIDELPARAFALSEDAQATPVPVPADQRLVTPVIIEAKILPNDRLAALVDFGAATPTDRNVDLIAFAQVAGEWLIDEVVTNYAHTPATPTAD